MLPTLHMKIKDKHKLWIPTTLNKLHLYVVCITLDLGIWDLSSRLTFWKLERLEKEKSLVREHLRELVLSEETAETPIKYVEI